MKVAVMCAADTGVEMYRQIWPARAVAEATGWEVRVYGPSDVEIADAGKSFYVKRLDLPDLDLVVLSRTGMAKQVRFIREMQRIGVAVVIDVDDDLSQIHPDSASYQMWNSRTRNGHHYLTLKEACETADLVTVTTLALERKYGSHGRVERLPNRLPYMGDFLPAQPGPFTILWSGALASHRGDLEVLGDSIRRMVNMGATLRIVGSKKGVAELLGIPDGCVTATGYVPVTEWHQALAREAAHADVGIVPLALNAFNQAKSYLKGMEYLGASLPVIASPTQPYQELATKSENVRLAETPEDWAQAMGSSALLRGAGERSTIHRAVRDEFEAARGQYVLADGVQGWIDAWQRAVDRRKSLFVRRSPAYAAQRSGNLRRKR